jgi:hypothetical protein
MVVPPTGEVGELAVGLFDQFDVLLAISELVADLARGNTCLASDAAS